MNSDKFLRNLQQKAPELRRTDLYSLLHCHLLNRQWKSYPDFNFRLSPPPEEPERMLVVQLSSIGDVTYTTPTISALADRYPQTELHFLTEKNCAVGIRQHSELDKLWTLPANSWMDLLKSGHRAQVTEELREIIHRLKKTKFDYLLNLHTSPLAALLTRLIEPAAFNGGYLGEEMQPVVVGNHHHFSRFLNVNYPLISAASLTLFADAVPEKLQFHSVQDQESKTKISKKLEKFHDPDRKLVLLNTGSRMEERVWPASHCARTTKQLLEQGYEVGLIGGPEDEARLREVSKLTGDHANLIPWFEQTEKLVEDLYLADQADLTITTDSGPQHLISCRGNTCLDLAGDIWVGPWNRSSYTLRANSEQIEAIEPELIVKITRRMFSDTSLPALKESATTIYQAEPETGSVWYRHLPLNQDRPDPAAHKNWLKGMFYLMHQDQRSRELGWRGLNLSPTKIREIYESYWSNPPPEITSFKRRELEEIGRVKIGAPEALTKKFTRWEEQFYST